MTHQTARLFFVLSLLAGAAGCADRAQQNPVAPALESVRGSSDLDRDDEDRDDDRPFSLAVIGDIPYGQQKRDSLPLLISLINHDPAVERVIHVGDIKAGKNSPCTDQYFADIKSQFDTFEDPLVYTPGDNEWTDCHAFSKNNGLFTPTERLQAVRNVFFPAPGWTLGIHRRPVVTQADDPANAQYVENVLWTRSNVVFATVNITGSNNDGVSWGAPLPADAGAFPSQATEQATRATANAAWIDRTFALANRRNSRAVVLAFQADMWDTSEPSLTGFDALVTQIGTLAARFGRPVLLVMGDSHVWTLDNPFSATSPLHQVHPDTPVAENVTRLIVEGSDKGRTEYTRLTVDPESAAPFTLVRVPLQ